MNRKILHLDLDAFFCAVEELQNPDLRGKAFAVGGRPEERGVVASCSYAARRMGVRSAMPMGRALRLCPGLIIVDSRHHLYGDTSRQVMERLHRLTDRVEQISIDEAFVDASDLPESGAPDSGESIARNLQRIIREELNLPCSLGVATNKLVAKIANDFGKAAGRGEGPPNAITVIPPGQEASFLAPLPVLALWGVGPKTAERLQLLDVHTIGALAARLPEEMAFLFGKNGVEMVRRARGIDESPIVTSHETKSISREITFSKDVRDGDILRRTLREMSESVGKNLREERTCAITVTLKLRWSDFTTLNRQKTLPEPFDQDNRIYETALELFARHWLENRPVRLIGVGVSGLCPPARQLSLWDAATPADPEEDRRLQAALDALRERFGKNIVRWGKPSKD